jgi:hypothetical protein
MVMLADRLLRSIGIFFLFGKVFPTAASLSLSPLRILLYHQNHLLTRVFCSSMTYLLSPLMCATIISRRSGILPIPCVFMSNF